MTCQNDGVVRFCLYRDEKCDDLGSVAGTQKKKKKKTLRLCY